METKAHHVMVGAVALAVIVAAFLFALWLDRFELDKKTTFFDIVFKEAVSGLRIGSDVRFKGIKVGEVAQIGLDEHDPSIVRVRIEVEDNTPVRTDSIATLQLQGLTGLSYVQISGGSAGAERLMPSDKRPVPVIASETSGLQGLMEVLPEILERLQKFVDEKNSQHFANILKNLDTLTGTIAGRDREIDQLLADMASVSERLSRAARDIEEISARTNAFTRDDMPALTADLKATMNAARAFTESAERITTNSEGEINRFARSGLSELEALLKDSRRLVDTLDQLANELRDQPARVLAGETLPEYEGQ
jgi:phospholipid/cholesterol/gamma-HCH transport system substrate-binding protein